MSNNFLQYELWKDCNNHCPFCYNRKLKDIDKYYSLSYVLNDLKNRSYDEIGFIGGEFFDGQLNDQNIKKMFYELFNVCQSAKKIYLASSLIFENKKDLYEFLQYARFNKFLEKILVCTSYDIKYRFKHKRDEHNWKNTMIWLHNIFPELKIHTEIILSKAFMQAVLDGTFIPSDFEKKYFTKIDYIEANYGYDVEYKDDLVDFLPDKTTTVKFLQKVLEEKIVDKDTFLSDELIANTLLFSYNGKFIELNNRCDIDNEIQMKSNNIISNKRLSDKNLRVKEIFHQMINLK